MDIKQSGVLHYKVIEFHQYWTYDISNIDKTYHEAMNVNSYKAPKLHSPVFFQKVQGKAFSNGMPKLKSIAVSTLNILLFFSESFHVLCALLEVQYYKETPQSSHLASGLFPVAYFMDCTCIIYLNNFQLAKS